MIVILLKLEGFNQFLRPLLIPILIYYLIESTQGKIYRDHLLFAGLLILLWIGDLLLVAFFDTYFSEVLLIYSTAHLLIIYLIKNRLSSFNFKQLLVQNQFNWGSLMILSVFSLLHLNSLNLAVYELFIFSFLVILATTILGVSITKSMYLKEEKSIVIGSIILLISDMLIIHSQPALHRNAHVFWESASLLSYGISYFMITKGLVERTKG